MGTYVKKPFTMPASFLSQPTKPNVGRENGFKCFAQGHIVNRVVSKAKGLTFSLCTSLIYFLSCSNPWQSKRVKNNVRFGLNPAREMVIGVHLCIVFLSCLKALSTLQSQSIQPCTPLHTLNQWTNRVQCMRAAAAPKCCFCTLLWVRSLKVVGQIITVATWILVRT